MVLVVADVHLRAFGDRCAIVGEALDEAIDQQHAGSVGARFGLHSHEIGQHGGVMHVREGEGVLRARARRSRACQKDEAE
jgi:hypothetical protein